MKNQKLSKNFRLWSIVSIFFLAITFSAVFTDSVSAQSGGAAGLIPCGNGSDSANRCTLCHLVLGFQGLISYGFKIFVVLALLMLVVGGVLYIISAGDKGLIDTAKGIMKNTLYGFVFVLLAWLIVNYTIFLLGANVGVDHDSTKTWNNFTCSTSTS